MNIFKTLPDNLDQEHFQVLVSTKNVRVERIVSLGHTSPEHGWYDQLENEWVIVLEGSGTIQFEDGREVVLNKGDHLNIKAHEKHRVSKTDPENITIWLAVFYS